MPGNKVTKKQLEPFPIKPLRPENKYMYKESLQDVKDFNSLSYSQQEPALALYIAEIRQAAKDERMKVNNLKQAESDANRRAFRFKMDSMNPKEEVAFRKAALEASKRMTNSTVNRAKNNLTTAQYELDTQEKLAKRIVRADEKALKEAMKRAKK